MKPEEATFMQALLKPNAYPRKEAARLHIPPKKAAYICSKWAKKGWYDWGVNILAGWLTPEGREEADKHEAWMV